MADKDFKVKNGIDVAGNAKIDGNLNAAKYQTSAPSSPVVGQLWVDSDAVAGVLNQNDYATKISPTFTTSVLGGTTFSAFTTTNNLTIGRTGDYENISATNSIFSGGVVNAVTEVITVTDNYSTKGVDSSFGQGEYVINIGTGAIYAGDGDAYKTINIGTGSVGGPSNSFNSINIGATGATIDLTGTVILTGAATINSGRLGGVIGGFGTTTSGSNLTVTHGLGATPTAVVATINRNSYSSTVNFNIFTGNIGATTFTVFTNTGAGAATAADFSWVAIS
jgi:hypothetical protein